MLAEKDIIDEILERMPDFEQASEVHKKTCVQVAQFLNEGDKRLDRLTALESAMESVINTRLDQQGKAPLTPQTRASLATTFEGRDSPGKDKLPEEYRNVLSTVLKTNESQYGFSFNVFLGFVQPDTFRLKLREGVQFKDPTVPGVHGEFTHRLQWYMITAPGGGLSMPQSGWLEFYKWVGTMAHTKVKSNDEADWAKQGLWDALFDRNNHKRANANGPYNTKNSPMDFRSPENLHEYLTGSELNTCPLLKAFLEGRHWKRWNMNLTSDDQRKAKEALQNYVAKKLFNNSVYKTLDEQKRAVVDARLTGQMLFEKNKTHAL
jgi:hypothetical protein